MKVKRKLILLSILLMAYTSIHVASIQAQEPLDGRNRIFRDDLIDKLAGDWKITRQIRGKTEENTASGEWVLNHQFLRLHMKDTATPSTYEAMVFIGYDNTSERYVAHWIDVFGGRVSETLGYGKRTGNSIKINFEYPDGPFTNTFTWEPETTHWVSLMEQKNQAGKRAAFAEDTFRRP